MDTLYRYIYAYRNFKPYSNGCRQREMCKGVNQYIHTSKNIEYVRKAVWIFENIFF